MSKKTVAFEPKGKVPPLGKRLFERQKYANPAGMIAVCVGLEAFARARSFNLRGADFAGLVLPDDAPEHYIWPVSGAECLIAWDEGPSEILIGRLALCLDRAGATSVTSLHVGEDPDDWTHMFDLQRGKIVRVRHGMHTYSIRTSSSPKA